MDRMRYARPFLIAGGTLALAAVVAACSASGSSPSPSDAMMEASPSDAMMEPSPSAAMMEESPSDAMMEPSPSAAMMEESPSDAMMEASPSDAMAATPVATGTFHPVDGTASGTAALFHQPDGSYVVTFEGFSIASADGTHVILVPATKVTKDGDVDAMTIVDLGALKGTTGMQDFTVPAGTDASTYHSVVLWDTGMGHVIAAAPLQ